MTKVIPLIALYENDCDILDKGNAREMPNQTASHRRQFPTCPLGTARLSSTMTRTAT